MRRKVIRQGHNTFTVSLPKKWCDSHNLKEGEEIDIGEKGDLLILSKEAYRGTGEIDIDITGLERGAIMLLIESLYTYGYGNIKLTTKDAKIQDYMHKKEIAVSSVIQNAISRLIGAELVNSSKNSFEIEVLIEDSQEKFDVTLRRLFLLIISMFESFIEGIRKKDKSKMEAVETEHINIKKFSNYALRLLNKFGYLDAEKTTFYFAIIKFLGKFDEIIKNFAGYTIIEGKLDLSEKCADMIEEINEAFKKYYGIFYKYDLRKMSELHKERDLFKQKLYSEKYKYLTKEDVFVLAGLTQCYDIILDLIELRMAIEH
jgi:phosphate uptake regulator